MENKNTSRHLMKKAQKWAAKYVDDNANEALALAEFVNGYNKAEELEIDHISGYDGLLARAEDRKAYEAGVEKWIDEHEQGIKDGKIILLMLFILMIVSVIILAPIIANNVGNIELYDNLIHIYKTIGQVILIIILIVAIIVSAIVFG